MVFSSITFLFAFLPAVLLAYYISPKAVKNLILMLFSLLFYAWGEPKYILVMLTSIIVGYTMGILTDDFKKANKIKQAKIATALSITVNLGILFFFKYIGFFTENINNVPGIDIKPLNIALPIGISFYTFQILSYAIDVYTEKAKVQKNIINLATYITLFPQLIAGPIVRYETVAEELDNRRENIDDFGEGAKRFIIGLGKKVLIANVASEIFEQLSSLPAGENSVALSWICAIAFSLRIYFDFAGYSDMAIGLGKMFGFHFLENFNYPYISKSITDFWRRWHISLSSWFRDYVYIPLGGNRGGKIKTLRNIFIVWLLTGFWHGAAWNFVIWGLYYFVLLMAEKLFLGKLLEKIPTVFSRIYALFFINLGWVIFAYDDIGKLGTALKNMFGMNGLSLCNQLTIFTLLSYGVFFVIAFIGSTPLPKKFMNYISTKTKIYDGIEVVLLLVVMMLSTAFLASDAFNPFLYFRF
ncbi:MAG: MBOAT family protein [Lachnospiraceae bacterium]|nr:MBOAT family protein [Lachnospiraceae bacterium]